MGMTISFRVSPEVRARAERRYVSKLDETEYRWAQPFPRTRRRPARTRKSYHFRVGQVANLQRVANPRRLRRFVGRTPGPQPTPSSVRCDWMKLISLPKGGSWGTPRGPAVRPTNSRFGETK